MNLIKSHCTTCAETTKWTKDSISNILHLLLTIVTGGLWVVVWVLLSLNKKWTCSECGSRRTTLKINKVNSKDEVNHFVHFCFSVLTLGLWMPIWIAITYAEIKRNYNIKKNTMSEVSIPSEAQVRYY